MADMPLTPAEMEALIDKVLAEREAEQNPEATPAKPTKKEKVKDALKAGAKQGRGGLGLGAKKQFDRLEEEGY